MVMKLRVAGCSSCDLDARASCILTVWRPTTEWQQVQEGSHYRFYNLMASQARSRLRASPVLLSTTRQSRLQPCSLEENYRDLLYEPREVWTVCDLRSRQPRHGEFDFVGIIIDMEREQMLDTVYAADVNKDIVAIKFWKGMQNFGTEKLLAKCSVFVGSNLLLRTQPRSQNQLVWAEACIEASSFSKTSPLPTHSCLLGQLNRLSQEDIVKVCHECSEKLRQYRRHFPQQPSFSPRLNKAETTTAPGIPVSSLAMESSVSDLSQSSRTPLPQGQSREMSQSLGSSTPQTDRPPAENGTHKQSAKMAACDQHLSLAQQKIAHLLSYGSPKPLRPLACSTSPAAKQEFKLPTPRKLPYLSSTLGVQHKY